MIILSSGDPVPWELLYPFAPGDYDAGFLAEQLPISRWVFGAAPVGRLNLSQGYFVLPTSSLPTAQNEVTTLSAMLNERGIATHPPLDDLTQLLQLFKNPTFSLLHFSCHNSFKPQSPTASSVLLGSQPFQPTFLNQHCSRFRNMSPLVFMNACRTDGQAQNYTRLAGWANSFLACGVGAFIGSLWEVRDRTASAFALEFYKALLGKDNLGTAMKKAREAIKEEPGDPTWLAYTLYGDPAATLVGAPHE
jgi:CHAT domain-containing protein